MCFVRKMAGLIKGIPHVAKIHSGLRQDYTSLSHGIFNTLHFVLKE